MFWGSNSNASKDIEQKDFKKMKKLDCMETAWNYQQKQVKIQKLVTITNKKQKSNNFLNSVLAKCKLHGCPATCLDDISKISGNKSLLRLELQYQ